MLDDPQLAATTKEAGPWPGAATTPDSPTAPGDYLILEAVYLAALTGVVVLTSRRERSGQAPIPRAEFPVLAVASFALAHTLAKEKVSTWLREPFVREGGDHKPVEAEGIGLRRVVGELLTCTRCLGPWSALALVGVRIASPSGGRTVATVLALSGANNVAQSAFCLLNARATAADADVG